MSSKNILLIDIVSMIEDDGNRINKIQLSKIFEAFYRESNAR